MFQFYCKSLIDLVSIEYQTENAPSSHKSPCFQPNSPKVYTYIYLSLQIYQNDQLQKQLPNFYFFSFGVEIF